MKYKQSMNKIKPSLKTECEWKQTLKKMKREKKGETLLKWALKGKRETSVGKVNTRKDKTKKETANEKEVTDRIKK